MARDQVQVTCPPDVWTQITNADVTNITFQAQDGDVFIRVTTNTTAPTETYGVVYGTGTGEIHMALSSIAALAGAVRVWARPVDASNATVYVDHA